MWTRGRTTLHLTWMVAICNYGNYDRQLRKPLIRSDHSGAAMLSQVKISLQATSKSWELLPQYLGPERITRLLRPNSRKGYPSSLNRLWQVTTRFKTVWVKECFSWPPCQDTAAINCWYCCLDVLNWFKVKMFYGLRDSEVFTRFLQNPANQKKHKSSFTRWCMRTCYSSRCSEQLRCQTRTRVMQPGSRRHWGVWHQYHIVSPLPPKSFGKAQKLRCNHSARSQNQTEATESHRSRMQNLQI